MHEDLVVTERIDDLAPLGYYIYNLCEDKPTYRMQRRSEIMGKWPVFFVLFIYIYIHLILCDVIIVFNVCII